jgi:hypothetical protein
MKTFQSGGKLVVLGSVHIFTDEYLEREDNMKILVCRWSRLTISPI